MTDYGQTDTDMAEAMEEMMTMGVDVNETMLAGMDPEEALEQAREGALQGAELGAAFGPAGAGFGAGWGAALGYLSGATGVPTGPMMTGSQTDD